MNNVNDFFNNLKKTWAEKEEASIEFGNARTCARFKTKSNKHPVILVKGDWVISYFNIRSNDCSDYIAYRQSDVDNNEGSSQIPAIEFKCKNYSMEFVEFCSGTIIDNVPHEVHQLITELTNRFKTTDTLPIPVVYSKLYIAVLDEVPDFMVPTLVAHSILGAHLDFIEMQDDYHTTYLDWLTESFRKCVVRVNRKEFEKISKLGNVYLGHENTTLGGEKSCAIPYPVMSNEVPKVLKFAKLWKPDGSIKNL